MRDKSEVARLYATFEECRFEHDGAEAWRARDLMPRLGYSRWENFREAVRRAWQSCESAGIDPTVNFLVGDGSAAWMPEEVFREATNAMPESVKDRPTRAHEYLFMFSKSEKYYYDRRAILDSNGRNKRSVWNVNTTAYAGAHFATFPAKLIEPCVKSSTRAGDVVLDPFFGSGTAGVVAAALGRRYIGIELHPDYIMLARRRLGLEAVPVIKHAA